MLADWRRWLLLGLLLALCSGALAHRLKVFALAEGGLIEGRVYFVGGAPAAAAAVSIMGPQGTTIARPAVDAQGHFRHQATRRVDHLIVADSQEGHVARWTVAAAQLPEQLPAPDGQRDRVSAMPAADGVPPDVAVPDADALVATIERAVARQVNPLREQLQAYEEKARMQDILGGLGYIAGLAGLALWWGSRRNGRPR